MHIIIDGCCLGRRKTGNETYLRGLLAGLEAIAPDSLRLTILTTEAHQGPRSDRFTWQNIPLGNFLSRNFLTIPSALQSLQPDLFHGVYWSRFFAQPVPTVLMVHDLSFVSFPQGFHAHERWVYANLVRQCAKAARHLLTVSEFSKSELITHWGLPPEKISVTYDGLDACYAPAKSGDHSPADPPYLLYVGNLHPRKNLVRLLKAFVKVKQSSSIPHRLRIVGQAAWMAGEVFREVRESGFANEVDFTGYVSYEELTGLYQRAALCLYPSLYEGFGLPVLEAMACGCPVVCSNTTSLPEVAGEACLLVDPESVDAIAQAMKQVLQDVGLRNRMRDLGPKQAARFTWEACAQATIEAYMKALS